jgi:tetratricopeptide (TPR) repeat protein
MNSSKNFLKSVYGHKYFWPLFLFVLSLSVRLIYLFQIKNDPLLNLPILDGAYYDNWAKDILAGREFTATAFFVEPGYAYILAFFYKIFGVSAMAVALFQFLLSSATAVLMYFLGKKLFGQFSGIAAGLAIIFLRPLLFYDGLLLKTSVEIFLITLILYAFTNYEKNTKYESTKKQGKSVSYFDNFVVRNLIIGLLIGLTAIVKANVLYTVPFLILAILIPIIKKRKLYKSALAYSALIIFGALIPVLPVTYHNWRVSHSLVLINYSGGPNIYIGNWLGSDGSLKPPEFISMSPASNKDKSGSPASTREDDRSPASTRGDSSNRGESTRGGEEDSWVKMTKAYVGKDATPAQVSSYWISRAIKESKQNPGFFLKNTGKKILLLFHSMPLDDNYSIEYAIGKFKILYLTLPFWIVALLGIMGMILNIGRDALYRVSKREKEAMNNQDAINRVPAAKNHQQNFYFLYAIFFGYALTLVASHVAERYRLALSPILVLFASYFIFWFWERFKKFQAENFQMSSRNVRIMLVALLALALAAPVLFISLGQISRTMPTDTLNNFGSEALDQGKTDEARGYFIQSIEAEPRLPMAHGNLGRTYLEEGNLDPAIEEMRKSIKLQPDAPIGYLKIALEAKKNNASLSEIKKQIEDLKNQKSEEMFDPNYIEAMKLLRAGKYKEAVPMLEKTKEKSPDNSSLLVNLGSAYKNTDQLDKAKEVVSLAILADGYNLSARYNMVNIQRKKKENDLALTQLGIINGIVPGFMLTQLQLAELYAAKGNIAGARKTYQDFLDDEINVSMYPNEVLKTNAVLEKLPKAPAGQ